MKKPHKDKLRHTIASVCNGIKLRIRKEKDQDKKAMWAIIGLELNNFYWNWNDGKGRRIFYLWSI